MNNRVIESRVHKPIDTSLTGYIYFHVGQRCHFMYQRCDNDRIMFECGREYTNRIMKDYE